MVAASPRQPTWPIAILAIACACSGALAQEPRQAAPSSTPQERRDREQEREQKPGRPEGERKGEETAKVVWNAPQPLKDFFEKFLPPPKLEQGERRGDSVRPWIRDARRKVADIAASEGYFSPAVEFEFDRERPEQVTVNVTPGPRTTVASFDIEFAGDIAGEGEERQLRRNEIRDAWTLREGRPFRSADWDTAKTRIQELTASLDYAAATLDKSEAVVDAEAAKASLKLLIDSGPRFTLGNVEILGLERYPEAVVRRVVDVRMGERYSAEKLSDLQRAIQSGPWFSSVVADIERDPARHLTVPIRVTVTERPTREVGLAIGYGTDDGARAEAAFRHRNLFHRGFDLQSSVRVAQERQIGFVDVYMPPGIFGLPRKGEVPFRDSAGVLVEHSTIEKLALSRFAVAAYRHFKLETWETRVGLSYQIERSFPEGSEPRLKRALAPIVAVTWRHVDDLFDPKKGGVLNVQLAAGAKALASGDDFLKAYGQYQYWIPVTPHDQIVLRTEIGSTFAASREHIPEDFLFRAGGSRSNRGYAFQSLGVREGNAIVGGRYILTGTAEFVHWLNDQWGGAVFTDIGDAADTPAQWNGNPSYGVGARYKTPAGPFALDLAYAERARRFRLSFSVTVAF